MKALNQVSMSDRLNSAPESKSKSNRILSIPTIYLDE